MQAEVKDGLREGGWASIERCLDYFRNKIPEPPELHHKFLRDAGLDVLRILRQDRREAIPKDLKQRINSLTDTMVRIACVQTVRFARSRIAEMSWEVKSLRDAVVSRSMGEPPRVRLDLNSLLALVVAEHHDHARTKGIELRLQAPTKILYVRGVARDLSRALEISLQ